MTAGCARAESEAGPRVWQPEPAVAMQSAVDNKAIRRIVGLDFSLEFDRAIRRKPNPGPGIGQGRIERFGRMDAVRRGSENRADRKTY